MGFAGASSTHEHCVALLGDELAAGEVTHECLVDRRAHQLDVVEESLGARVLATSSNGKRRLDTSVNRTVS
jgi:hypothetical protein